MLLNEQRMLEIEHDLEIARERGSGVATRRVINHHFPWVLNQLEGVERRMGALKSRANDEEVAILKGTIATLQEEVESLEEQLAEYQQLPEEE